MVQIFGVNTASMIFYYNLNNRCKMPPVNADSSVICCVVKCVFYDIVLLLAYEVEISFSGTETLNNKIIRLILSEKIQSKGADNSEKARYNSNIHSVSLGDYYLVRSTWAILPLCAQQQDALARRQGAPKKQIQFYMFAILHYPL